MEQDVLNIDVGGDVILKQILNNITIYFNFEPHRGHLR
jgi:hypothetical protein